MAKRQAGGFTDYTVPYSEGFEASYLVTPHMVHPLRISQ